MYALQELIFSLSGDFVAARAKVVLQVELSAEAISGLCQIPDENHAVAASEDGRLLLQDLRKAGSCISEVSLQQSLKCCQTDGQSAVAGSSDGQVCSFLLIVLYSSRIVEQ